MGEIKDCCKDESNLVPETVLGAPNGVTMRRCRVCQCRHFEATVDPLKMGVTGAAIG